MNTLQVLGLSDDNINEARRLVDKVDNSDDVGDVEVIGNYCKVDMDVLDKALRTMTPSEQTVYMKLYRESFGNQKNHC